MEIDRGIQQKLRKSSIRRTAHRTNRRDNNKPSLMTPIICRRGKAVDEEQCRFRWVRGWGDEGVVSVPGLREYVFIRAEVHDTRLDEQRRHTEGDDASRRLVIDQCLQYYSFRAAVGREYKVVQGSPLCRKVCGLRE